LQVGVHQWYGGPRLFVRGDGCLMPWSDDGMKLLHEYPLGFIATVLSGWINLIFLITVGLIVQGPGSQAGQCVADSSSFHASGVLDCFLL
jgi:hypothetical protein